MRDEESTFVEEMGQALAAYGMTPMAGRMWGWLLICEPPEQTAAQIAEALHASRGAISGTARILAGAGSGRRSLPRSCRNIGGRSVRMRKLPVRSKKLTSAAAAKRPPRHVLLKLTPVDRGVVLPRRDVEETRARAEGW